MNRKILFGCYEVPGYGGANTATYQLFQLMREDKFEAFYLNIIDEQDADYYRYVFGDNYGNPRSLAHVYNCILNGSLYGSHPELTALIRELSPDVLIGVDFIAALLMKQAYSEKKLIFLTAGCQQVKDSVIGGKVRDVMTQNKMMERTLAIPDTPCSEEQKAVDISDLIITHSDMTLSLYRYFFPYYTGKIYPRVIWFGEWIYREALNYARLVQPFSRRDIDVLFIASSWGRPEKNYQLVKKIVSQLKSLKIHIVGEVEAKLPGVTHHGFVTDRGKLFDLMGRAKTVASPSLYDAAPGILFEASAMGCNVVASKNCGNWKICNDQLLIDPFTFDQFLQKIRLSLSKKFDDNMGFFLETESYRNLTETALVV
jgi:glycosyltransferase involved in cell wall biosynthesis